MHLAQCMIDDDDDDNNNNNYYYLFICKWAVARWHWCLCVYVGLRATWKAYSSNLESWDPSQYSLLDTGNQEKPVPRWPVVGPYGYWLLASKPATRSAALLCKRQWTFWFHDTQQGVWFADCKLLRKYWYVGFVIVLGQSVRYKSRRIMGLVANKELEIMWNVVRDYFGFCAHATRKSILYFSSLKPSGHYMYRPV
jgi:hypothetical protein